MNVQVKIGERTFHVEVGDLSQRPIQARVDGQVFEVWPQEDGALPIAVPAPRPATTAPEAPCCPEVAPAAPEPAAAGKLVTAPIPGVIVAVLVKPGQQVEFGQQLCTLEAMKMKNAIRAGRAGTIAAVHVATGDTVRHGQTLVEFSQ
ncbi:MAG: biotin/lipoyl-binding protein [Chloroflexi bacterium]|nr:biotin/lipoyl-containing protein [Anaerolineaceae bacterium]NMB90635.1 biotin/lipoyl-binding protein [Chloroflexota bacterium]